MPSTILIAYYTRTGNTHTIASAIQRPAGGTLVEIRPVVPYPPSYQAVLKQAQADIKSNARPAIEIPPEDPGAYGTLFIGSPVWWRTLAPPVAAFLATPGLAQDRRPVPYAWRWRRRPRRERSRAALSRRDRQARPDRARQWGPGARVGDRPRGWPGSAWSRYRVPPLRRDAIPPKTPRRLVRQPGSFARPASCLRRLPAPLAQVLGAAPHARAPAAPPQAGDWGVRISGPFMAPRAGNGASRSTTGQCLRPNMIE